VIPLLWEEEKLLFSLLLEEEERDLFPFCLPAEAPGWFNASPAGCP
jgi:hypothetical protein